MYHSMYTMLCCEALPQDLHGVLNEACRYAPSLGPDDTAQVHAVRQEAIKRLRAVLHLAPTRRKTSMVPTAVHLDDPILPPEDAAPVSPPTFPMLCHNGYPSVSSQTNRVRLLRRPPQIRRDTVCPEILDLGTHHLGHTSRTTRGRRPAHLVRTVRGRKKAWHLLSPNS